MRVIDFHAHYFSRTFFETLAAQSPLPGDVRTRLAEVSLRTGIDIPGSDADAHMVRWTSELERHKVEHLCAFASVPEETPVVCEAAARSQGRLSAFAFVNPRVEGAAARVGDLLASKKARGVLLFPAMHHYSISGPEARALLDVLEQHAAICYVHCGLLVVKLRDVLRLPRPQDLSFANPVAIVAAANAHPGTAFVIPHFGAGFFREALMAGASAPNVYFDTSSSNGWTATQWPKPSLADVFARALDVVGHERVLFGTDSNTFPTGWRKDRFEEQHAALRMLGVSTAAEEAIFSGNARRLLRLA